MTSNENLFWFVITNQFLICGIRKSNRTFAKNRIIIRMNDKDFYAKIRGTSSLPRGTKSRVQACDVFRRPWSGLVIQRYKCFDRGRSFSDATLTHEYCQRRRRINEKLFKHLVSLTSSASHAKPWNDASPISRKSQKTGKRSVWKPGIHSLMSSLTGF